MKSNHTQDEKLLAKIRAADQVLLKQLHLKYWSPFFSFFVKRKNLNQEEILDIYAKAFSTFYFNIRDRKLEPPLQSSLKSYLIGIGKNYMLKYFEQKKRNKEQYVDNLEKIPQDFLNPAIDDYYANQAKGFLVKKMLSKLDSGCRRLIQLSFIEENADDAIAIKMDISSEGAVRQRRFKCLEKLRKLFKKLKSK